MSMITRYIFRKCFFYTFLMFLAFLTLFSVFNILGQIGDLGKGEFTLLSMLIYTILLLPNYAYLLAPLAILIGVMLALLNMAHYSEYTIIRTSGVSLNKLMLILVSYGMLFTIATSFLGEFISPLSSHYAQTYKKIKTHEIDSSELNSGVWSKDGENEFVNIKQFIPTADISGISILRYDDHLRLQQYLSADSGRYDEGLGAWVLNKAVLQDYSSLNIESKVINNYVWHTRIDPKYFSVLIIAPEEMSAMELHKYMQHLQINNQAISRYEVAFWEKLFYPFVCTCMALIALAFIPDNSRNISLGTKLFIGILLGIGFFFTTRLIGFIAFLFHWNAVLAAAMPVVVLFITGWYLIIKRERR